MPRGRRERDGDQRRRAGDEPVEHHRDTPRGAREDHADETADLEAADLRQHVEPVPRVGPVDLERPAHDRHLARQRRVVDAGAASGDALGRAAGERRRDRAGGRRVADAHLAGGQEIGARGERLVGQRRAGLDRPDRLLARHRRARGDVGRAGPDRAHDELGRAGERSDHAEVGHHEPRPRLARQHVHRGAPAQEVLDHLRRHDLGIRADALGDHAVIGGEREDDGVADLGRAAAQERQAQRDLLEPSEAPGRLGEAVQVPLGRLDSARRGRRDRAKKLGEARHRPLAES